MHSSSKARTSKQQLPGARRRASMPSRRIASKARRVASKSVATSTFRRSVAPRSYQFDISQGLGEESKMFVETARQFARTEIAPFAAQWDRAHEFDRNVVRKAADIGFTALYISPDVGGLGLGRKDSALVFEALATADPVITAYLTVHHMASYIIDKFGTPDQRQKWSPRLSKYEIGASYALTEPGAGSDAGNLATTAVKDGNDWILNGSKCFITGAGMNEVYVVMARTGAAGPKGISAFIVEKDTPGFTFGKNEDKMGWHASPTRTLNFDNVRIPAENLIGQEGKGFSYAMQGLNGGRINISSLSLGAARSAYEQTVNYVKERKQFGHPIADNQWVQFSLADMATKLTASRLMVLKAAEMVDENHPDAVFQCAMAKAFATENCSEIAQLALQLHGGYGYLADFPLEKIVRDLRVHEILEGTNQIMRLVASRHILKE